MTAYSRSRPALFLDRDGVLVADVGYLSRVSEARWIPGSLEALARLARLNLAIVVTTNQSGVGRGIIPLVELEAIHAHLRSSAECAGGRIDAIYYCPHHPTLADPPYRVDCECRKPKPGMLLEAARDLALDLSSAAMVGDRDSDVEAGQRIGLRTVRIGASRASSSVVADATFPSLLGACDWLEHYFIRCAGQA